MKNNKSTNRFLNETYKFNGDIPCYAVINPNGSFAGSFCISYEEARELANQKDGRIIYKLTELNKYKQVNNENLKEAMSGYVLTDCAYCGEEQRVKVDFPDSDKGFTTRYYNCKACGKKNKLVDEYNGVRK